jgi:Zn-dependent membrane protease YugP
VRKELTGYRGVAYALLIIGIVAGVFSFIRVGSLIIATAMAVIVLSGRKDAPNRGVISTNLPILIAISLFAMAIALPRGL